MTWPSTDGAMFRFVVDGWPRVTVSGAALVARVRLCAMIALACTLMARPRSGGRGRG
ncbi:MAG TPA: hypothetical protein VGC67_13740 [Cellulomonas sp.]